jgi:hypothetical protein
VFIHIGFVLNTEAGQEVVNRAMEEDLYQVIADRCDVGFTHGRVLHQAYSHY